LVVEVDRRAAIATAIAGAGTGDVIVIAGKGHERTQDVGGRLLEFDDRLVARDLLEDLA
jgi:UDP-N-acetylmuramoyl-L-alanyl-D-glutamate--2,6-diaminopimelate ligase